jgi:F-type H+-transporting ATPase subunit epsilon
MAEIPRIPSKLQLSVVTRERKVLQEEVDEVVLPGWEGALGILPGHTPMLAMLRIGELMYRIGNQQKRMVLSWGFAEVLPARVIVLAEGAVRSEEIDLQSAQRARAEAEKEIASLASHDPGFALIEARLQESIAQIEVASRM